MSSVQNNSVYMIETYASQSFRDFIINDDIEGVKTAIGNGTYPVTASEVKNAASGGSMKCLRWLMEDMKVQPCYLAVPYALKCGQHESVIYLLRNKAPINLGSIRILFDHYWFHESIRLPNNQEIVQYAELDINIDSNDESVFNNFRIYMHIIITLVRKYDIEITLEILKDLFIKLWRSWIGRKDYLNHIRKDINYLLQIQPNIMPLNSLSNNSTESYILSRLILMGIGLNDPKDQLENVAKSIFNTHKLSIHVFNECMHDYSTFEMYKIGTLDKSLEMWNNLSLWVKRCGVEFNTTVYPYPDIQGTELILSDTSLPTEFLLSWLLNTLRGYNQDICMTIIEFLSKNNRWSDIDNSNKYNLIIRSIAFASTIADNIVEATNWIKPIKWINIIKRFGNYHCNNIRGRLQQQCNTTFKLIDFSPAIPSDYEIIWTWIGIRLGEESGTYHKRIYEEHPINPSFENIHTLNDLKNNVDELHKCIRSPTGCYFKVMTGKPFYYDSQGCIIWAFDDNGYIYIYDDDNPYIKQYVAKSLPEFLSHIYDDSNKWRDINN